MSAWTEEEKLNKAFDILANDEDTDIKINEIKKCYLAILSNSNLVDKETEPEDILALAIKYYNDDYEFDIRYYLAKKIVIERFD